MTFFSIAQTEAEIKAKAETHFKNKEYIEATPLYLRLLSLQPKSFEYSYNYGTCLLFNSNSKQDAIRYLAYAVKSPTPIIDAHFFLGKAYHLNYQFNDAIKEYKNYINSAGIKGEYIAEANRNNVMCENGKNLLSTVTEILVKKKTEIKQEDFFRLYDLTEIGGSIIVAVDFQTKNDKKYNHKPLVHILPQAESVYFSSYGDGDNLDIYIAKRLPGGKFGIPQKVAGGINTPFDEDFPYMHPNGKELYFSSKGHNSMGGYDVFKAEINPENNASGEIENIDFAISSPDDDIMYIVDKDHKNAYFSSKRQSQDGKITVYKVGVARIPIQLAIIKGSFQSTVFDNQPKMQLEIYDKSSGKKIGFTNSQKDNSYLITFPKGGKYEYRIKIDGSKEQFTADVEIPFQKELKPLKQIIVHDKIDELERVRVTNQFDQVFDDPQSIIAQVLKDKANLNVNEDQFDLKELENGATSQNILAELNMANRSLTELGQIIEQKVNEINNNSTGLSKTDGSSNGINVQLYNEIATIDNEIRELVKEADASTSNRRKELVLTNAKELYQARDEKLKKIDIIQKTAAEIGGKPSNDVDFEVKKLETISKQYNQLLNEGKNDEATQLLSQNKDYLKTVLNTKSNSEADLLFKQQNTIDNEIKRYKNIEQVHTDEVTRLTSEIASLQDQKNAAKEKVKQDFQDKIDEKTYQLKDNESAITKTKALISKEEDKRSEVNKKLTLVSEIENFTGKSSTKEDVQTAKSSINEEKIRTLKNYIESSLSELKTNINEGENISKIDHSIEKYNAQSEEIYANNELTDYQKQNRLLNLNSEKKKELEDLLRELENDNSLDDAQKSQQKQAIQKSIQKINEDQTSLKNEFEKTTQKEISNLKTENIISEIFPEYSVQQDNIQENNSLSEIEKLEQKNQVNNELSQKIEKEILTLNQSKQADNSLNKLIEAKTELLANHNKSIQNKINQTNEQIAQLKSVNTVDNNDSNNQINAISNTIEEQYNSGLTAYKTSPSPTQSISILSKLKNDLIEQQGKLKKLDEEDQSNNEKINNKLVSIENQISEIEMLISNEQLKINSENNTAQNQPSSKSTTEIESELKQNYSGNIDSDFEKTHATIEEIQPNIQRLNQYETALHQQLLDAEKITNEQEKTIYKTAIQSEIQRTQIRKNKLEEQIADLNQIEVDKQQNNTAQNQSSSKLTTEIESELKQNYSGNINSDFEKTHATIEEIQPNIQRLNQYETALHQQLLDAEKITNQQEKAIYKTAIQSEIQRTQIRKNKLEEQITDLNQIEVDKQENNVAQNQPNSKSTTEITSELKQNYLGNIDSDFEKTYATIEEIQPNIQRLNQYETALHQQLLDAEKITNEQEKANYKTAIQSEIQRTQIRKNKLEEQIADLNQIEVDKQENNVAQNQPNSKSTTEIESELKQNYSGNINSDFEKTHATIEEIQPNIQRLNQYETALHQQLLDVAKITNEQEKTIYKTAIQSEIQRTQIRINSLEEQKTSLSNVTTSTSIKTKEEDIMSKLSNDQITKTEQKQLNEELLEIKKTRALDNIRSLTEINSSLQNEISILKSTSTNLKEIEHISQQYDITQLQLTNEIKTETNPLNKEILLTKQQEINQSYINILERNNRLNNDLIYTDANPTSRIYSQENLEQKKRIGSIEFEELTRIKESKTKQVLTASKKDKINLQSEISSVDEQLNLLETEESFVNKQLKLYPTIEKPLALDENNVQLSYNDERQIAASESYENYAKAAANQNEKLTTYEKLKVELSQAQKENETNKQNRLSTNESLSKIRSISEQLSVVENEIINSNQQIQKLLPTNHLEAQKYQNLVARNINPIKKSFNPTAIVPISKNGIEFNPQKNTLPELKTIPVDVESPKGLVYRVQVGAFAKPIPEELFKEFTPVSGEKINNTNITRYMAGYFNNAVSVVDAKNKIQQLGYADAFIVAYCDGKRITFGEARNMEARNECLGQKTEALNFEVATKYVEKLGIKDTSKTLAPVSEWSYNQIPGSAPATAIEAINEFNSNLLFYTVQVGVYNRPVTKDRLLNLEPLYTLRLENGQIRYSVGIFGELGNARVLESEIRTKGIKDAFVTAYFKGKRITLDQAKSLIASGEAKLFSNESLNVNNVAEKVDLYTMTETSVFNESNSVSTSTKPTVNSTQLISKDSYDYYPKDELKAANQMGSFYFDSQDRRIKSTSLNTEGQLNSSTLLSNFENVTISSTVNDLKITNESVISINSSAIPGDFSDWLLKFPYRKTIKRSENGIEIHIFDVNMEDYEELKQITSIFSFPIIQINNRVNDDNK